MDLYYLLVVISIALIVIGSYGLVVHANMKTWVATKGVIRYIEEKHKDVALSETILIKYFFPEVRYEYEVEGRKYISEKVAFNIKDVWVPEVDQWGQKTADSCKVWSDWKDGSVISVYYNPRHPEISVAIAQAGAKRLSHYIACVIGGIVLLVVCMWMYVRGY